MEYNPTPTRPCRPVLTRAEGVPLTDAEQRLVYMEVARLKAGGVRFILIEPSGQGIKVTALVKAP